MRPVLLLSRRGLGRNAPRGKRTLRTDFTAEGFTEWKQADHVPAGVPRGGPQPEHPRVAAHRTVQAIGGT
jgi:hypothetical protein